MKPIVLFLVGPTASGKSKVAVELARRLNAEIISADSMLVYRGFDIGTAKPTAKERKGIRHHLIDILPPGKTFSMEGYRRKAVRCIRDIVCRGKVPLVVGGSGLYIRALWAGWASGVKPDLKFRKQLEQEAARDGSPVLYERLRAVDPARARQIQPNDQKRIIRALEIIKQTKSSSTRNRTRPPKSLADLGYQPVMIGIQKDRARLYRDIEKRVDAMFRKGLVREVRGFTRKAVSNTARQALGYKEIFDFLKGEMLLSDAKDLIKKRTRHFAKRQMTWFRREPVAQWFSISDTSSADSVAKDILLWLQMRWNIFA